MIDHFALLKDEVQRGLDGKNSGINMGFKRLNKYVSIKKRIYTTIIGGTGTGKSAFLHNCFILNPYDWYISKENTTNVKLKIVLFSLERSKLYTIMKWLSRKIFLDHGILISTAKLLGWWDTKLTPLEHDYFLAYEDYIDEMLENTVDIIEGSTNPTGVYKYMKNYAENHGRIEKLDEYRSTYIPDNDNEVVIVAVDHMSLIRKEKGLNSKKEAIDKLSEMLQHMRDFYSYSPVVVMQQNRDMSNPLYLKSGEAEPSLDHAKDSSTPVEDSDCVISLHNPRRYNQSDASGYNLDKFVDPETGSFYFRSIKILKSTYSEADIRISMGFQGITGNFKELPKIKEMENFNYDTLFTGNFFLQ